MQAHAMIWQGQIQPQNSGNDWCQGSPRCTFAPHSRFNNLMMDYFGLLKIGLESGRQKWHFFFHKMKLWKVAGFLFEEQGFSGSRDNQAIWSLGTRIRWDERKSQQPGCHDCQRILATLLPWFVISTSKPPLFGIFNFTITQHVTSRMLDSSIFMLLQYISTWFVIHVHYTCSSSLAAWRFGEENVDSKGRRSHQHNAGPGLVGTKFHRDINLSGEQLSKSNCENNPENLYLI